MVVRVQSILDLASLLGSPKIDLEMPAGSTVRDVLASLADRYGEILKEKLINPSDGAPYPYLRLVLNGRDLGFLKGLDTVMHEGDTLTIIPPACGG